MPITDNELKKIAALAYIKPNPEQAKPLEEDVRAIIKFVEQLRQVETKEVSPLFHPLDLHQRFRADQVTDKNSIEALENIAPQFEDSLYLVPKVIETGT